jgi:hypothetical protein
MMGALRRSRVVWLGIGLLLGSVLAGLWPHTPLHATATDRSENIIVATGVIDENNTIEAIFFLDSLTGRLRAAVPSLQSNMPYQATWWADAGGDLARTIRTVNESVARGSGKGGGAAVAAIPMPQAPRFLMVTGLMDIRGNMGRMRAARSVVHVVEANTGIILTYMLPWSSQMHTGGQLLQLPMQLWAADLFPTAPVRTQE